MREVTGESLDIVGESPRGTTHGTLTNLEHLVSMHVCFLGLLPHLHSTV